MRASVEGTVVVGLAANTALLLPTNRQADNTKPALNGLPGIRKRFKIEPPYNTHLTG